MKRLTLFLLLLAPFCSAEALKIGTSGISFTPPTGFTKVPQEIIDVKWPGKRAPRHVVGNKRATTTIAYDLKPNPIPQDKLREVKAQFTAMFEKVIPGLVWKKKEIIELAGQKWLFLEMTSTAVDTDIHNIMLLTGFKQQMLIFNFNSTKEDFPKYEKQLRASLKSIKLPYNSSNTPVSFETVERASRLVFCGGYAAAPHYVLRGVK